VLVAPCPSQTGLDPSALERAAGVWAVEKLGEYVPPSLARLDRCSPGHRPHTASTPCRKSGHSASILFLICGRCTRPNKEWCEPRGGVGGPSCAVRCEWTAKWVLPPSWGLR